MDNPCSLKTVPRINNSFAWLRFPLVVDELSEAAVLLSCESIDAVVIVVPVMIVATVAIVARTMTHRFRCVTVLSDGPPGQIVDRVSPAALLIP
jgi:hypothetical protein